MIRLMKASRLSKLTILVTASIFLLFNSAFGERVYLDITASELRKIIVAVPDFQGNETGRNRGRSIAQLLGNALELHGFIDLVDTKRYGGIKDVDWRSLGVDYVVMGKYTATGNSFSLEGRLLDVAENRLLAGRRYRGTPSQWEDMSLFLADGIVEEFTGEPGISRTSIAFISDVSGKKEVYVSDLLGRRVRQVTKHRHLCVSPRFSPDGDHLAYTTYHRGNQDLYITNLRQSKVTRSLSRRKGMNLAPAFSPDGKRMVATLSKDGNPDLYMLDRSGKILKRLTFGTGINVSASYSPDGQNIVFVSDRSGKPQIYTMHLASGKVRRLTFDNMENSEPAWSPKGDLIAFTGWVDGHYHLFTMTPNGDNLRRLTTAWGDYESASWSPDGKMLTFTRRRNGKSDVCIINKNGKGLKVLFAFKGNKSYPRWSPRP